MSLRSPSKEYPQVRLLYTVFSITFFLNVGIQIPIKTTHQLTATIAGPETSSGIFNFIFMAWSCRGAREKVGKEMNRETDPEWQRQQTTNCRQILMQQIIINVPGTSLSSAFAKLLGELLLPDPGNTIYVDVYIWMYVVLLTAPSETGGLLPRSQFQLNRTELNPQPHKQMPVYKVLSYIYKSRDILHLNWPRYTSDKKVSSAQCEILFK